MPSAAASPTWLTSDASRRTDRRGDDLFGVRLRSTGIALPETRRTTDEVMNATRHKTGVKLAKLTGIHERRVVSPGEDSFVLSVKAARDAMKRADLQGHEIDCVINCSITRYKGRRFSQRFEPALSLSLKQAIGAANALNFDVQNACAGMLTGVFLMNNMIRRGIVRRGLVVSGEHISGLSDNASQHVRHVLSRELASLTIGDSGAAVILERSEDQDGLFSAGITTLAAHSRLCLAYPNKWGPGHRMFTKARQLHKHGIAATASLLNEALDDAQLELSEVDWVIPHQTSSRAIRAGYLKVVKEQGQEPANYVDNLAEFGNTSSTSHFVALHKHLSERRFKEGESVMMIAQASGFELGYFVFRVDELVDLYGNDH
ncbi:MAG: 3-oxoacyl-ACP synthase [Actinobacteria bacterium]|nr:3-oxoacyl-ACP synthase [Actinomycetota bacterium]MCB9390800.1 3-oxoacyl-ACP synthase [Acidimicrobiia bacterium]